MSRRKNKKHNREFKEKQYNYIKSTPKVTTQNIPNRNFHADNATEKWLTESEQATITNLCLILLMMRFPRIRMLNRCFTATEGFDIQASYFNDKPENGT